MTGLSLCNLVFRANWYGIEFVQPRFQGEQAWDRVCAPSFSGRTGMAQKSVQMVTVQEMSDTSCAYGGLVSGRRRSSKLRITLCGRNRQGGVRDRYRLSCSRRDGAGSSPTNPTSPAQACRLGKRRQGGCCRPMLNVHDLHSFRSFGDRDGRLLGYRGDDPSVAPLEA